MTLRDQWEKIKDNWLIVLVIVVVFGFLFLGGGSSGSVLESASFSKMASGVSYDSMEMAVPGVASSYRGGYYSGSDNFAPEVTERLITKTASLSSEVKRGEFMQADAKLKNIVKSSDSYLLNENVNNYGTKQDSQYSGSYQIKFDTSKYDSIIPQLKEIGEVKSFNENADDITGQYTDMKTELAAEKERMRRYQEMYNQATSTEDKINLNDRIFNQERTIKYLEDAISNMDNRVSYSTVYVSLTEKQSSYANITLVKFGELIRSLVNSFNSLLSLIFVVLPYAVAGLIIWLVVRVIRRKKK
jgi:hypothetical protein